MHHKAYAGRASILPLVGLILLFLGCPEHTEPPSRDLLASSGFHTHRQGLEQSRAKFTESAHGRIAFLGGSITFNTGWRDSVMAYFEQRFPETVFDFIPAGIPSMGSTPSAFRLERDVLSHGQVDLIFQEAAVNDATNRRSNLEQLRAQEGIVRHLKQINPAVDIIFMHFVDPDKMTSYRAGDIPVVIQNHERVAKHYSISSINLAREVTARIDSGEFTWEDDFRDLHPSPFGQGIYAQSIITFLDSAYSRKQLVRKPAEPQALPVAIDPFNYQFGRLENISRADAADWIREPNWLPKDSMGTRHNYTEVPMLIGTPQSGLLQFKFEGTGVGIVVAAGQDAGIISYRIDEGAWQNQNLFTRWSPHLHLPWYYTLASSLDGIPHKLEINVVTEKDDRSSGNFCRIRYFYVNGASN